MVSGLSADIKVIGPALAILTNLRGQKIAADIFNFGGIFFCHYKVTLR